MNEFVIPAPAVTALDVEGGGRFPVRRIFCVGKNYADHVKEMGGDARSDPPVFFTKPADAATNAVHIPFPPKTDNLHFEGELVVALGVGAEIFGYAAGCDLTRRDLQASAKAAGAPWDMAKAFDHSAPIGPINRSAILLAATLKTIVNDEVKQQEPIVSMIWSVEEIIRTLGEFVDLKAGDLIFTGTPSGVGAVSPGDKVRVEIDGLPPLSFRFNQ